jgi:hypothetical protein
MLSIATLSGFVVVLLALFNEPAKNFLAKITQIANRAQDRCEERLDALGKLLRDWLSQKKTADPVKTFFGLMAFVGALWLSYTSFTILVECLPIIFPFQAKVAFLAGALVVTGAVVGVFFHLIQSKPLRCLLGLIALLVISVQVICAFQMAAHLVQEAGKQSAAVSNPDEGAVSLGGQSVSLQTSTENNDQARANLGEWPLTKETVLAGTNAGLCAAGEITAYYLATRFTDAALARMAFAPLYVALMILRFFLELMEIVLLFAAAIIRGAELLRNWMVRLYLASRDYFSHAARWARWVTKICDRAKARLKAADETETLEQKKLEIYLARKHRENEKRKKKHTLALENIQRRKELAVAKREAWEKVSFFDKITTLFLLPLLIGFVLFFSSCSATTPAQGAPDEGKSSEPVPKVEITRWPFQRPRYVVVILDLTVSFKYLTDAEQAVNRILEALGPKDIFVLLAIKARFDPAQSVAEARMPELRPEIFTESSKILDYERKQAQLNAAWKRVAEIRKAIQEQVKKTSATLTQEASQVWEPLEYASRRFSDATEYDRVLVVLSDLKHEVAGVRSELPPDKSNASFSGTRVEVLFVPYRDANAYQKKSLAWESWFKQKGAQSVVLRDPAQSRLAQPVELSTVPKLLHSPFKKPISN